MAIASAQTNEGVSTSATIAVAFGSAPTSGNLITLHVTADATLANLVADGWTASSEMQQIDAHEAALLWRISNGSNSMQYRLSGAAPSAWVLAEWSGVDATPYDVSEGQRATSSATSYTTASMTPTAGDRLLIAQICGSKYGNTGNNLSGDLTTWTNSFTHLRTAGHGTGSPADKMAVGVGYRLVTANGSTAYSSGATFPSYTADARSGLIIAFKASTGGGNKTLDANAGTYSIGGTAATPKIVRKVAADSGSYAITGTAATLRRGFKAVANSGSYTISGSDVSFARSWNLVANSGSYSIAGTAANLEVHRQLVADSATYTISGTAATLKMGKAIAANSGSYSITGANAGLLIARELVASGGTYSITGSDVTLSKTSDKVVVLETGNYAINGSDASLSYSNRIMVLGSGTYQIGGYPVDLFKGLPIPRNSLNEKIKFGGPGSIGDLARMGSDIEVNFPKNKKFKEYGPGKWPDMARQGGDVVE